MTDPLPMPIVPIVAIGSINGGSGWGMVERPRQLALMRLKLPERKVDTIMVVWTSPRFPIPWYNIMWYFNGFPDFYPRVNKYCQYWIQYVDEPAVKVPETHLILGDN